MSTTTRLDRKIAWCFSSPNDPPAKHSRDGRFSVMYLLRRELIDTAGYNPDADNEDAVDAEGVRNRLFASLIVMFTAIDLLAKFQFGDKNGVGDRFTGFLT